MRLRRRTFLQMALATACAHTVARAEASLVRAEIQARLHEGELVANLALHNDGPEAVDVLLTRGARSAIGVRASLGTWTLVPREQDTDRELLTRAGPRLVWQPVPAGGRLAAGTFHLVLPPETRASPPDRASFELAVETDAGTLHLTVTEVPLAAA